MRIARAFAPRIKICCLVAFAAQSHIPLCYRSDKFSNPSSPGIACTSTLVRVRLASARRLRFQRAAPSRKRAMPISLLWVADAPSHDFWCVWKPSKHEEPRFEFVTRNCSLAIVHVAPYTFSCTPCGSHRQPESTCVRKDLHAWCVEGVSKSPMSSFFCRCIRRSPCRSQKQLEQGP